MEEKVDYYSVGTRDNIVISSSSLKFIDPEQGGHPKLFLNFFDKEKEETKSMALGTLIHKYVENKDAFLIGKAFKPSDKMGQIADYIIHLAKEGNKIGNYSYETAIRQVNYYSNRWEKGMSKLVEDVKESCKEYVDEVIKCIDEDLTFLTEQQHEKVINAIKSIDEHKAMKDLLFYSEGIDDVKSYTELEVYFKIKDFPVTVENSIDLYLKAKIDKIIVDFENKVIKIVDNKTSYRPNLYTEQAKEYKVFRQLAFYKLAFENYFLAHIAEQRNVKLEEFKFEFYIACIGTDELSISILYKIHPNLIASATGNLEECLDRIAYHIYNQEWQYSKEEAENGYVIKIK